MNAPRYKIIDRVQYKTLLIYAGESPNFCGAVEAMVTGGRAKLYSLKGAGFYDVVTQDPQGVFDHLGAEIIEADVRAAHLRLMRRALSGICDIAEIGSVQVAGYPMTKVEIRMSSGARL